MGCRPSRTACSSVGPPKGHKSYQETTSSVGSSLHGSASPCEKPAPARVFLQVHSPFLGIPLLWHGALLWAAGVSLHLCGSPWTAGAQLLHHSVHHWLQGNLVSGTWTTSCPSFSTDPGVSELFLSPILTLLFSGLNHICAITYFSFLKMLSQRHYCHS